MDLSLPPGRDCWIEPLPVILTSDLRAVYAPAMLAGAAVVAVVPPLLVGEFLGWLYRGLVVLTVSCACALLISAPVSVVTAVARAARDGVLIKGGAPLDALVRVRVLAVDKTGTLAWTTLQTAARSDASSAVRTAPAIGAARQPRCGVDDRNLPSTTVVVDDPSRPGRRRSRAVLLRGPPGEQSGFDAQAGQSCGRRSGPT